MNSTTHRMSNEQLGRAVPIEELKSDDLLERALIDLAPEKHWKVKV